MSDVTQNPPSGPAPVEGGDEDFSAQMAIAARNPGRAEFVVGLAFFLAILAVPVLGWIYTQRGQPQIEGMMLAVLFGGIGFGMAAWGKWLMPRGPFVEEREVLTSERNQERFAETFKRGQVAIEGRRSFLVKMLVGAMGLMGAILLFPLRSLTDRGPRAGSSLYKTEWKAGVYVVDESNRRIRLTDIPVGGSVTVFPEGFTDAEDDQTMLLHVSDQPVYPPGQPEKKSWSPGGYLAFSKVCTHAGCPVGQYEAQFQKLLCPCHESTFDVLNGAQVVFGPAPRPLPQLPLTTDGEFLMAASGYGEPIGPGFWSRDAL